MTKAPKIKALAYLRTSSAANVGPDKDSDTRQLEKIERFAGPNGYELVGTYYDAAVSGADALETRPGFSALLARITSNGVRTVIVEDASRFARDLMVQETGLAMLRSLGVTLMTANGDNLTQTDSPEGTMLRHMLGSFAQFEKAKLVGRLKHARDAKRALFGKCGGRKAIEEREPEACARAVAIVRSAAKRRKRKPSLRNIAAQLAAEGMLSQTKQPFTAKTIATMLA